MKGKENLVPLPERTKDAQRAIQSKGGKVSAEKRRERKSMREGFNAILTAPIKDKDALKELKAAGVTDKDAQALLLLRVYKQAAEGNIRAAEFIAKVTGEFEQQATVEELPATNFLEALIGITPEVWGESEVDE